MPGALEGIRVLDLTEREGHLCGRLLADLGAEVIKIEPLEGDPSRRVGPFSGNGPGIESSLTFINLNTNKKGVTLDLSAEDGRQAFRLLARGADAVIETFAPGTLEAWDLDYETLSNDNPGLVMVSITGFGLTGPYRHFKAPSIVCTAMGGVMSLCGSPDRPPLAELQNVPYDLASAFAAYGALLALRHKEATGQGQRVEVSCQEVSASQQHIIVNYSSNATVLVRPGNRSAVGGGMPYGIYPADDGFIHLVVIATAHWRSFVEWMGSPDLFTDPMWDNRHLRIDNHEIIEPITMEFTQQVPKADLFLQGQAHHITVGPINRPDEFIRDSHFRERDLDAEVQHPVIGRHRLMRSPFRLSDTPAELFRPAPLLGEHNSEVLKAKPAAAASRRRTAGRSTAPSAPLEGIRVLDFTLAIAGPYLARLLAENGAEVIKVESRVRQQRGRISPGLDPRLILQGKVTFDEMNRSKRCIAVDMSTEEGRQVIKKLVPHCDVVLENFSPRVMDNWGLGYQELRTLRRDILMVRLPGFGTTGPYRNNVGLAAVAMGMTGMYHLWSYSDSPEPAGPPVWTPDYLSAAFGGVAVLAALRHRDLTGQGQLIELSQVDAAAFAMGNVYLDHAVNGYLPPPMGNRHRYLAPHGAYPCKGDDAWCVIAVQNEDEWQALCRVLGSPAWRQEERFSTMEQRLSHQDELDQRLGEWTREYTPHQVMLMLQKEGVPAGAVQHGETLFMDPHLRARGFLAPVEDPDTGPIEYPGTFVRLSETPGKVERCHALGEDNLAVIGGLLNMSEEEIRGLEQSGVLA
ncbi:MAG: CoA transferase [Dehalococcoidia bacterium]|jgi:crotonobetainyl-CoA:carnitine CoA-transferase CaiB-like acyl-CoA transferase|nr:CoA transferase [Dehalococcoidia bacterium]